MRYRNRQESAQAADELSTAIACDAARLAEANINPATGLASDYLNHFHEAIMLLEMMSSCPDCREDFLGWRPKSYREHFVASRLKSRDLAIAAYDTADPDVRGRLDVLAGTMTAVLEAARSAMSGGVPSDLTGAVAERAVAKLKPLVARAGAVINGDGNTTLPTTPQAMVDGLMKR